MKTFRLMLLGSVVAGVGAIAAIDASAADVEKSVKMYGHVNRMTGIQDTGGSSEIAHMDNSISSSRFGINASAKSANLTVGAKFEWQFQANSNSTGTSTQSRYTTGSNSNDAVRHSDVYFSTQYGKLSMGHGDSASNDAIKADLSGTDLVMFSGEPLSRGMGMCSDNALDTISGTGCRTGSNGTQVQDFIPDLDGQSRVNRIRYDTPRIAGFSAKISNDHGGVVSYGADYRGELLGTKLALNVGGYSTNGASTTIGNAFAASVSAKHSSGINLTYAWGARNSKYTKAAGLSRRPETHYAKIGYQADFFGWGPTSLGVDYNLGLDGVANGDVAAKIGVGVVQKLSAYGTEIYAAYENVDYKGDPKTAATLNGMGYDEVNAGYIGARVKF